MCASLHSCFLFISEFFLFDYAVETFNELQSQRKRTLSTGGGSPQKSVKPKKKKARVADNATEHSLSTAININQGASDGSGQGEPMDTLEEQSSNPPSSDHIGNQAGPSNSNNSSDNQAGPASRSGSSSAESGSSGSSGSASSSGGGDQMMKYI